MTTARVPPSDLYFALLESPVSPRGKARAEELTYALEAALPVPIDTVHAVYRSLPDGRVLAVGIDRDRASALCRVHTSACPEAWPDWLRPSVTAVDPASVNLLTGPCRSPVVVSARNAAVRHALLGVVLLGVLGAAGVERRIRAEQSAVTALRQQSDSVYRDALGPAGAGAQPAPARMTSELRRLRATRGSDPQTSAARPADAVLAELLGVWPDGAQARTESITVAERTVEVLLRVDDFEAAQGIITALGAAPGLRPGPAKTDREPNDVRVSLRFDREDAP